uniref:Small ribosomal subunit protein uS10 domain-containing protein n=1 Tax=Periophthalmus magnuspinnatus TaxID=409849 RepID=A0A3B3ZLS1_9GOBI
MNPVFRKVRHIWPCICPQSVTVDTRQYKGMPTHTIGKWKYLLPKEAPKKKKDKQQMKQVVMATQTAYGTLNVKVSGFDMTLVEHYAQYIHRLCDRLSVSVTESYALPTKTTEVSLMQDQGTKMFVDAVLKTHKRVVQVHLSNPLPSLHLSLSP